MPVQENATTTGRPRPLFRHLVAFDHSTLFRLEYLPLVAVAADGPTVPIGIV